VKSVSRCTAAFCKASDCRLCVPTVAEQELIAVGHADCATFWAPIMPPAPPIFSDHDLLFENIAQIVPRWIRPTMSGRTRRRRTAPTHGDRPLGQLSGRGATPLRRPDPPEPQSSIVSACSSPP